MPIFAADPLAMKKLWLNGRQVGMLTVMHCSTTLALAMVYQLSTNVIGNGKSIGIQFLLLE